MKIAIHHRKGSFSDHWIKYCEENNLDYKIVNAFDSDIIEQIKNYDVFMWHHHQENYKDVVAAKKILFALEHAGIKIFPDFKTGWHFDDKVAQKYLLEAIKVPLVPSYIFYDKEIALNWAKNTSFPKVFKLKGGASSANVKLVRNFKECKKLISKAFGRGFSQFNRYQYFIENYKSFQNGKGNFINILKGLFRIFVVPEFAKLQSFEKGYVYFQDFIPNNTYDTRVVVIGCEKAIAEKRFVRKNDFRASGSGEFSYENINIELIQLSFSVAKKMQLQSVAFDFIYDENNKPLIVEISYGFGTKGINNAPGYWDKNLNWHSEKINSENFILMYMLKS